MGEDLLVRCFGVAWLHGWYSTIGLCPIRRAVALRQGFYNDSDPVVRLLVGLDDHLGRHLHSQRELKLFDVVRHCNNIAAFENPTCGLRVVEYQPLEKQRRASAQAEGPGVGPYP